MLAGFVSCAESADLAMYRDAPAVYARAPVAESRPWPSFGDAGTGGIADVSFCVSRQGYRVVKVAPGQDAKPAPMAYAPFSDLMQEVKAGFGRTMAHLPAVFGVSRQTLYNWLAGETPKEQHQAKLNQLAAAARVFTKTGFKPTPLTLERTVASGKSLIQLLRDGADGEATAQKLVRIVQRSSSDVARLDAVLEGRTTQRPDISGMGAPSFNEDV